MLSVLPVFVNLSLLKISLGGEANQIYLFRQIAAVDLHDEEKETGTV